jgi:hypothetical protein
MWKVGKESYDLVNLKVAENIFNALPTAKLYNLKTMLEFVDNINLKV